MKERRIKARKRKAACLVGLFALFLMAVMINPKVLYAKAVNFSFGAANYEEEVGGTFEIPLAIKGEDNIGAYQVKLQYDTTRMQYISGGEAEENGIITLEGTGWGKEISYNHLTFQAKAGGEAGILVKEAHIYSSKENGSAYSLVLPDLLKINIAGERGKNDKSFAQMLQEEKTKAAMENYGVITDVPIVGNIQVEDKNLYVVDMADYEPQLSLWDYKLVTDEYLGKNLTFLTDAARNVRVMLVMDTNENFLLYATDKSNENFYPVHTITENGETYFITSLWACIQAPEELSDEEMKAGTTFYGINMAGEGKSYRYTKGGELKEWSSPSNDATKTESRLLKPMLIGIGGVALLFVGLFCFVNRRLLRKAWKRGWKKIGITAEDKKQYLFVIRELTSREIKRKYARSYLGIIWSVLNPLLTMVVMSLIFSYMFKRSIENFPLYYLTGSVFWTLFSVGTNSAMTALVDNKNLLLKAKLPKQTFVLSRVYTAFVNFGYTCIAYVLMLIVFRIKPSWTMLLFIPDVLFAIVFATGIGYILSILYVFFADIKYLYSVLLTLLMYMSAIFYPVTSLPPKLQTMIGFNPIYMTIYIAREAVVYNHVPYYTAWIKLGISSLISLGLGILVFRKKENDVMLKI